METHLPKLEGEEGDVRNRRLDECGEAADEALWHCVRTRPKSEHIAAASLLQLGDVEVYCPRIRFPRSLDRGKVLFTEALFPTYIFARFVTADRVRAVAHAHAVTQVPKFGGRYATLPHGVIDQIKEEMGGEDIRDVDPPSLELGTEVEVASGPLRGMKGIITRLQSGDRVRILLEMFGELKEIDVNQASLGDRRKPHPLV